MTKRICFPGRLVPIVLTALLGLSCSALQGTNHICVDSSFMPSQKDYIRTAFRTWNQLGQEYLGYDLIADDGDCDLASFQIDDFNDDKHAVYNVVKGDAYDRIQVAEQQSTISFATRGDVAIFTFKAYQLYGDTCADPTQKCTGEGYKFSFFQSLVTHELGHFLGLTHVTEDANAVMNASAPKKTQPTTFTEADIRSFCRWYDCTKKNPP